MSADSPRDFSLCVVVPAYNEAANIGPFLERLTAVLSQVTERWKILFVNDGSQDQTLDEIYGWDDDGETRIAVIDLSRNFGKEAALTAGLDHADADAVIIMDCDL